MSIIALIKVIQIKETIKAQIEYIQINLPIIALKNMIIQVVFNSSFKHQNVDNNQFSIDVDANQTVSNLKTLISLKFTDLDPEFFELKQGTKTLKEEIICLNLQQSEGSPIIVTVFNSTRTCCTIF
ncbi:hypothetical protein TTHERM_01028870 (macronuclear) [Tetrahymena thermophila SB210]|uniref:Ubiquitin-like domain-containing protein n=1 Tax=Tetrahymena thermophila (strain SB210) TaxID=312017 RepID=Q23EF3_TETTS|nr:hypothetical protein TTHERM_01028870 [Tetrahymena thermophila SB210]EAR94904.2 hypothetical protein TTHERM_01028870 [Tetrahymena thermophila SB210]|eukprot:XP_001015149.2 hypothetical protein TTHERM_01028870 [Tetrahymena thermophila SB210]